VAYFLRLAMSIMQILVSWKLQAGVLWIYDF
jgi:hypothetical protein